MLTQVNVGLQGKCLSGQNTTCHQGTNGTKRDNTHGGRRGGGTEKSSRTHTHNTRTTSVRSSGKQEASSTHAFCLKGHSYLQALMLFLFLFFFHLRLTRVEFDHFLLPRFGSAALSRDGRDACTCSGSSLGRCSVFVQLQMTLVCI